MGSVIVQWFGIIIFQCCDFLVNKYFWRLQILKHQHSILLESRMPLINIKADFSILAPLTALKKKKKLPLLLKQVRLKSKLWQVIK